MTIKHEALIAAFAQAGVGALLLYAGWMKAGQVPMFAFVLQQGVPGLNGWGTPSLFDAANTVVFVEVLVGTALLVQFRPRVTRWIGVGLFLLFSAVLISMLARDVSVSCGCLGASPAGLSSAGEIGFGLARNTFAAVLLIVVDYRARIISGNSGVSTDV